MMKILILSDIHEDYKTLNEVLRKEKFDKLIVLGDLFSYGFKSDNLKNEKIIKLLLENKDKLILISGNCDFNINFESLNLTAHEIITLKLNGYYVTLTHGNNYNKGFMPKNHANIFISGHTHVPLLLKEKDMIYVNPGSIGNPRFGLNKSYIVFEDKKIIIKDIYNNVIKEMNL